MSLTELSDADRLAILEDPTHPQYEALIDELDSAENGYGPDENAPFGYMDDPATGERRPKKRPGNRAPKKKAQTPAAPQQSDPLPPPDQAGPDAEPQDRTPLERTEDRAPDAGRRHRSRSSRQRGRTPAAPALPAAPRETIPFRAGPIAKGMNKIYRRAGKLMKVVNPMLGEACISMTRKEDDDDVTVGEAWEELARVNPGVRGFLMKMVTGGAVGGLIMAHAPLLIALLMLEPIASRFPLGKLLLAIADDGDEHDGGNQGDYDNGFGDDDGVAGFPSFPLGGLLANMDPADMAQLSRMAQQMMDQTGQRAAGSMKRGDG